MDFLMYKWFVTSSMWSAAVFSAICGEMCIGAVHACEERCLVSGSHFPLE